MLVRLWRNRNPQLLLYADTEKQCEGFSVTATIQPGLPIPENHGNTCKMYMDACCTIIQSGQEAGKCKSLQIDE